jgi:hypothetical protein
MSIEKSILDQLGLAEIFYFKGEIISSSEHENLNKTAEQPGWDYRVRNASNASLKSIYSIAATKNHRVEFSDLKGNNYKIKSIEGVFIKNHSKFNSEIIRVPNLIFGFILAMCVSAEDNIVESLSSIPIGVVLQAARISILVNEENDIRGAIKTVHANYDKKISLFDEFVESKRKEFERIENTYADALKLQNAFQYFVNKSENHRSLSIYAFALFYSMIVLIIMIALYNWNSILHYVSLLQKDNNIFGLGLFTVFAAAIAWILRLVSRFYIQNISLWADAEQRATFVKTYLALQKEGGIDAQEKERILVLNAIFRATADQKDEDLAPPNLSELLKK